MNFLPQIQLKPSPLLWVTSGPGTPPEPELTEASTLGIGLTGGAYASAVVTAGTISEASTLGIGLTGGAYTQVVVTAGTISEASTLGIGLTGGSYDPA